MASKLCATICRNHAMLKDVFKNKREFLKYEIIAIDSASNLDVNKFSGIKWDNRTALKMNSKTGFATTPKTMKTFLMKTV